MVSRTTITKPVQLSDTVNIVLELLAVHPDYQRLGAGTALVKWGTHAADDKRVAVLTYLLCFVSYPFNFLLPILSRNALGDIENLHLALLSL